MSANRSSQAPRTQPTCRTLRDQDDESFVPTCSPLSVRENSLARRRGSSWSEIGSPLQASNVLRLPFGWNCRHGVEKNAILEPARFKPDVSSQPWDDSGVMLWTLAPLCAVPRVRSV